MRPLLPLAAFVLLAGCSFWAGDDPAGVDFDDYLDDRAALVAELEALIGSAEAESEAACRVVAVGHKACGGPAEYRVYSATDSDADAVEALAERIAELDREAIERFGLVSDCAVAPEPAPALVDGQCVAR
jgi:hypothetical protein